MSRIEEALEKAARMRETQKEVFSEKIVTDSEQESPALPEYQTGDGKIDTAEIDERIVSITAPYSPAAEQYRKLRAKVLRATAKDRRNIIMVTSAGIAEGKTMTSINLSISLAQELDYTVLLVDADLRNPTIHKYLGFNVSYGLSDYLNNKVDLSDVLIKTGIGKLVILPGGVPPENPAELLSSERMKMLVKEIKHRYQDRYIIFDSSPMLVAADPISLGGLMDAVLFVIQEGRTSQKAAEDAVALMKGWNILGAVFNNVPQYLRHNTYPYYYGSYTANKKSGDLSKEETGDE